jgi:dihydroorotate dehydrogenase electron transfer subunit
MKRIENFTVRGHKWLNYNNFLLHLESPDKLPPIKPGNFVEIKISNSPRVFVRRPFSIYDVDEETRTLSFYIKIIGEGTRLLGELRKGTKVNLIYPLGNTFDIPESGHVLIVAGGSGIAPFLLLARELRKRNLRITFLIGGRDTESIVLTEQFAPYGKVLVTTEDGSIGEKGLVTDHPVFRNGSSEFDFIYTCGPDPMMKAVSRIAREKNIPCEASLENMMGCGFGACLCCTVETTYGNVNACTEGPVFDVNVLKW